MKLDNSRRETRSENRLKNKDVKSGFMMLKLAYTIHMAKDPFLFAKTAMRIVQRQPIKRFPDFVPIQNVFKIRKSDSKRILYHKRSQDF